MIAIARNYSFGDRISIRNRDDRLVFVSASSDVKLSAHASNEERISYASEKGVEVRVH
jgi:hypothetical protein